MIQSCYFICPYKRWRRRRWWRQCVHGNVGGGVFSLLGGTIIFRLKLLLLRKPCPSPLSTTSHTTNRVCYEEILSFPYECVCRWREKKGKGRRHHRARRSYGVAAARARLTSAVVNCGNLERPVALARASAVFIPFLSSRPSLSRSVSLERAPVRLPASPVARPPHPVPSRQYARI